MLACTLLATTLLAQSPPTSQPAPVTDIRVPELLSRSMVVKSIDPEDDEDFSDLQPLKQLIGDSRLVVLGEQSHGDGADFLAKARLIKFMHQRMGFDVLAWESGEFDCREVDRALHDPNIKMDDIMRLGVFPIWTLSAQVRPTFDYVRSTLPTEHPIETCGFDHQFSAGAASQWAAATIAFFDNADPAILPAETRESLTAGFAKMNEHGDDGRPIPANIEPLKVKWAVIGPLMDEHREPLIKANGEAEFAFMRRCADDACVSVQSLLEFIAGQGNFKATDNNTRDQRMAANLIWLTNERYKNRKIIAWMASMHAANDIEAIKPNVGMPVYQGVTNCGTISKKALGATMYTIGFTAFEGQAANPFMKSPTKIAPPTKGSLEDLCSQTGKPFLFIDFRSLPADHWLRKPLISRPLGYGEMVATEAGWPHQMDAMFYIRTMFPSTKENALPPYAVLRDDS